MLRIAALLIFSSFFSVFFWGLYVGWHGMLFVLLRTVANIILGWSLAAGYRWARWAVVARCALGVFLAVSMLVSFPQMGMPRCSILGLWTLVNVVFYAVVGLFLVFSHRIRQHFDYSDPAPE